MSRLMARFLPVDGRRRLRALVHKILIVDDEPEIVDLIAAVLEADGLDLLSAYDGEQAMSIINEQHPCVVLSDVMMPRLNGWELCRQIRSNPSTSDTRLIMMSAARNLLCDECEVDGVVAKPFDIIELSHTIERFLDERA